MTKNQSGLFFVHSFNRYVGVTVARRCNNLSEESTKQAETDAAGDVPNTTGTEKQ